MILSPIFLASLRCCSKEDPYRSLMHEYSSVNRTSALDNGILFPGINRAEPLKALILREIRQLYHYIVPPCIDSHIDNIISLSACLSSCKHDTYIMRIMPVVSSPRFYSVL